MTYEVDDDAVISLASWKHSKRPKAECKHERTVIDQSAGTVECRDCAEMLSPFHVLLRMAQHEHRLFDRVRSLQAKADELAAYQPRLKMVKELERTWRGRSLLPCCPHCGTGLWLEELARSASRGVRYEITLRQQSGKALPPGISAKDGLAAVEPA